MSEASRSDIDANVTLQPGEEFALQGTGSILGGRLFLRINDRVRRVSSPAATPNAQLMVMHDC